VETGSGVYNLGSGSIALVCEANEIYKEYKAFQFSMNQITLEPEPKTFKCWSRSWSQNWSLKFESRLHRCGGQQ